SVGRRRDRSRRRWRARGMRAAAGERRAVEGDAPDGRSPGAAARHRARGPRLGARSLRGSAARARRHAAHAGGMNLREFNERKATEMTMHNTPTARFLMCRPEHFAVSYTINPWMDPKRWARDADAHAAAEREWQAFYRKLLELGAAVELVPPAPGLPDLVFTANAAVVLDGKALLARFRHPERQREEGHFETGFRSLLARGLIDSVRKLPKDLVLEGAGDCVWDARRKLFWMGYGPRSDASAAHAVEEMFGQDVVA